MVLWFGAQFGRSQNINVLELPFIKRPNVKQSTIAKDANVPNLPCCEHTQLLCAAWRKVWQKCRTTYKAIVCLRHTDGFTMHRFLIRKGPITDVFRLPKLLVGK